MNRQRLYSLFVAAALAAGAGAQMTPATQMERLDRGVVAVKAGSATFLSWRLLGTDDEDRTRFDIVRNGTVIAQDQYNTNYTDRSGTASAEYQVVTKVDGQVTETSKAVTRLPADYLTIPLDRPAKGSHGGEYTPNDCSVGDVDGDGQYELILKWDPSNSHDNSQSGVTDDVILDCYRLDGTRLWRIDLGPNIRAGAHYTQFMVYDFDGDGRAELMCKTAPGSKDGSGAYVNQAATDAAIKGHNNTTKYANSNGHILKGAEYLTVFDGLTGKALHTTWYLPGRAGTGSSQSEERGDELGKVSELPSGHWGDNGGNRSERYLAAVAHINGLDKPACGIFSRGYYTRAYVWAVSFDGTRLHTEWLHVSHNERQWLLYATKWEEGQAGLNYTVDGDALKRIPVKTAPANTGGLTANDAMTGDDGRRGITGSNTLYSNGNHNLSVADVDGDGCDEILWGSAALDDDGTLLYAVGYGHGDAMHLSDLLPDRPGLELFDVHEEKVGNGKGSWDLHDAATGEVIYRGGVNGTDNGRGLAADISKAYRGFEFWSSDERTPRTATDGKNTTLKNQSVNFRVYWNGDLQDELLDGHYAKVNDAFDHVDHLYITEGDASRIVDWTNRSTCNTTKMTPCLSADILGDWREEIVLWDYQNPAELYIHTTTTATNYRVPTLMHDHTYRMAVAWQNTAYNQPPHLGYYLPDAMLPRIVGSRELAVEPGAAIDWKLQWRYATSALVTASYTPDGTKKGYALPEGLSAAKDATAKTTTLSGTLTEPGVYTVDLRLTGLGGESVTETLTISVGGTDGVQSAPALPGQDISSCYDLQGRRLSGTQRGLNIVRRDGKVSKVLVK